MITVTGKVVNANGSVTVSGTNGPVTSWVVSTATGSNVDSGSGSFGNVAGWMFTTDPLSPGTYTITISGTGKGDSEDVVVTVPHTAMAPVPAPMAGR